MDEGRYRNESQFHDRAFGSDLRRSTDPAYAVRESRRLYFLDFVLARCAGKRILEYGCGPYSHARKLVEGGAAMVVGIDISSVAMAQYMESVRRGALPRVSGCVANAEQMAFPNASFDLVAGGAILHHLDLKTCFAELARVLDPAGDAVFIEPLGHNPLIGLFRLLTPRLRTRDEHPLRMEDFALARQYFGEVRVRYFNLTSLLAVPFRRLPFFSRLVRVLERLDEWLFERMPRMGKYAWTAVVVLSKPRPARPARAADPDSVPEPASLLGGDAGHSPCSRNRTEWAPLATSVGCQPEGALCRVRRFVPARPAPKQPFSVN